VTVFAREDFGVAWCVFGGLWWCCGGVVVLRSGLGASWAGLDREGGMLVDDLFTLLVLLNFGLDTGV